MEKETFVAVRRNNDGDLIAFKSNTGKEYDQIAADTERDNYMTAEEACAYGLIDGVITKR